VIRREPAYVRPSAVFGVRRRPVDVYRVARGGGSTRKRSGSRRPQHEEPQVVWSSAGSRAMAANFCLYGLLDV